MGSTNYGRTRTPAAPFYVEHILGRISSSFKRTHADIPSVKFECYTKNSEASIPLHHVSVSPFPIRLETISPASSDSFIWKFLKIVGGVIAGRCSCVWIQACCTQAIRVAGDAGFWGVGSGVRVLVAVSLFCW